MPSLFKNVVAAYIALFSLFGWIIFIRGMTLEGVLATGIALVSQVLFALVPDTDS